MNLMVTVLLNFGHKKKRPILAAHLSPLQAFLPVGMYRADSSVSTAVSVDQRPAAALIPWSILVGYPAHCHVSLCYVQILASTVMLSPLSLASNLGIARQIPSKALKYNQTVSTITLCGGDSV